MEHEFSELYEMLTENLSPDELENAMIQWLPYDTLMEMFHDICVDCNLLDAE